MTPWAGELADAWNRRAGSPRVVVEESLGSGGGVRAVLDGMIDVALVARPLTEGERARGLTAIAVGREAVIVAANPSVPLAGISSDKLRAFYAGQQRAWPDGSPAILLLRDPSESANAALDSLVPGLAPLRENAYRDGGWRVLYHDDAMAEALVVTRGAIGMYSQSALVTLRLPLRALAIDGVQPSPASVSAGQWRATRDFTLVVRDDRRERAQPLLDYVRSSEGQAIVERCGLVPAVVTP